MLLEARAIQRVSPSAAQPLLDRVNLRLSSGDRVSVVGPSGGGKTLLLRALALLDPVDDGEILWHNQRIPHAGIPSYRSRVIYLHQRPALIEGTVEDNLQLPFTFHTHHDRRFDRERILTWLAEVGRDESFLKQSHADLSGGESQLVALTRGLQLDPMVLLLDEPTAALDPDSARSVITLIERWHHDRADERAYIWVTHDQDQARHVSNRRLTMHAGRLREIS